MKTESSKMFLQLDWALEPVNRRSHESLASFLPTPVPSNSVKHWQSWLSLHSIPGECSCPHASLVFTVYHCIPTLGRLQRGRGWASWASHSILSWLPLSCLLGVEICSLWCTEPYPDNCGSVKFNLNSSTNAYLSLCLLYWFPNIHQFKKQKQINKNNCNILEADPRVSEHLGPCEFEATLGITEWNPIPNEQKQKQQQRVSVPSGTRGRTVTAWVCIKFPQIKRMMNFPSCPTLPHGKVCWGRKLALTW